MKNKYVAVDCRLSEKCCRYLENSGYTLIKIPCSEYLSEPVSAHPDMSLFGYGNKFFVSNEIAQLFDCCFDSTIISREVAHGIKLEYPYDIEFNCALVGKKLICNRKHTNSKILEAIAEDGCRIINVNQGYSKCSVCIVSNNAIITEDAGIANACRKEGIDVLLLETRGVKLDGYDYGFIGGSSGELGDRRIVFAGCIENHAEYKSIFDFCVKYGKTPISMSDEPLYDVGSIIEL